MTQKLTKLVIDKAIYKGNSERSDWDVRWDSLLPGFGVRIYPSGRKAFILRYRINGRKRLLTIGTYGPITLVQARVLAKQRTGEVVYKQTIVRLLTAMCRAQEIPFGWIADNMRWMRKPQTFDSMKDILHHTAYHYRRAVWQEQLVYVEIWLEKDALTGVLYEGTEEWDVPPTAGVRKVKP